MEYCITWRCLSQVDFLDHIAENNNLIISLGNGIGSSLVLFMHYVIHKFYFETISSCDTDQKVQLQASDYNRYLVLRILNVP